MNKPQSNPESPETQQHDRLVEQIETTLPEGTSPKGAGSRTAARLLFAFGAVAIGAVIVVLFVRGGWPAGLAGVGFLALYAFMGSTPWMAGALRARDNRQVEVVVDRELHGTAEQPRPR